MIGLVVVSHSDLLARGVAEVAGQMAPGVAIVPAGGLEDGGIGTSLERVTAALADADSGDGVVVLYDLGSAQMTAESAVEFLDDAQRQRIAVVDAPLVEGAITAATTAAGGGDLAAVRAAVAGGAAASVPPAGEGIRSVVLRHPEGLHARPAAQVVRALKGLDAQVRIERPETGGGADARSVLGLVGLAAPVDGELRLIASGPDAERALDAVATVLDG